MFMKTTDLFRIALKYKLQDTKTTQKSLAQGIGFEPSHISRYITKDINFSENKRDIIAEYFNMTSLDMLTLGNEVIEKNKKDKKIVKSALRYDPIKRDKTVERKKYRLYLILNIIVYIAQKLIKEKYDSSFHKILKIIYFADQAHLVEYENPITFDRYYVMDHGPVASETYNIMKMIKGEDTLFFQDEWLDYLAIKDKHLLIPLKQPDFKVLRKTAILCLDKSIETHKAMHFKELRDKSHDSAYMKTIEKNEEDGDIFKKSTIPYSDIAEAGGADEQTLEYIKMHKRWNM
ncbi:MAG: DUF4065 domain-containing protein [Desulfobacteraceae bacterium]|nr:DUF4065 domain-containing protein [Desulfobacteraceae bacterium]